MIEIKDVEGDGTFYPVEAEDVRICEMSIRHHGVWILIPFYRTVYDLLMAGF